MFESSNLLTSLSQTLGVSDNLKLFHNPFLRLSFFILSNFEFFLLALSGFNEDLPGDIGGALAPSDDIPWAYDAEDLEIDELPVVLRAMVGIGGERGGLTVAERAPRIRMKHLTKGKPTTIPTMNTQRKNIADLNRRITDLKMEGMLLLILILKKGSKY